MKGNILLDHSKNYQKYADSGAYSLELDLNQSTIEGLEQTMNNLPVIEDDQIKEKIKQLS